MALDDDLNNEALKIGKQSTKKGVVTEALKENIQRRNQSEIINLFNTIDYDESFDYKKQRSIK